MKDVMLDLETLGIRPTSVIVQIGACYFDRDTGKIGETFCCNIDVGSCLMLGLTIDQSTIDWWKQQNDKSWLVDRKFDANIVLEDFADFIKYAEAIWSHATFDIPILDNAYKVCGKKTPWHYRAPKDIRTLTHLTNFDWGSRDKSTITHNALEDCIYQVSYCVECFNKLKEKKDE